MKNYVIRVDGDSVYLEKLKACPEGDPELDVMREAIKQPEAEVAPYLELVRLNQGELYVDEEGGFKNLPDNPIATMLYWMTHGQGNYALTGNALLRLNDGVTTDDIARLIEGFQNG